MSDFFLDSLTEEERALLAQFEFRAIVQPSDTPVLYIHADMQHSADANSGSSEDGAASHTAGPASPSPALGANRGLHQEAGAPLLEQSMAERTMGGSRGALATALLEPHVQAPLPPELLAGFTTALAGADEPADDGGAAAPVALHVVDAAPVLLHQRQAGGHGDATTLAGAGVPFVSAAAPADPSASASASDTASATPTAAQQCNDLAERLLQLSAEVDAAACGMDRSILSPTDFC